MSEPRDRSSAAWFRRGVFFTGSGSVVNIALLFLETMVAVRLLSTDSYGTYVLLVAVVNFFVIAVDLGCKTSVTKLIASSGAIQQEALAANSIVFRVIVVGIVSIPILAGQRLLLWLDPSQAILQYAGYVPLMLLVASYDELLLGLLQGFRDYRHMAVAQIARSVLRLSLTVALLYLLKLGTMALVVSWIVSFTVSATYQVTVLPISKRLALQPALLAEMLRFGAPLQVTRLLWFAFGRVHVILLGTLAGTASVAYYDVAARIPDALQRLFESYTSVYFPTMAALLGEGKRGTAGLILNHSLRLVSFAAALMAVTVVIFSRQIVMLLFSEKYEASAPVFALLAVALHTTLILTLVGYTLTSAGFPWRSMGGNLAQTTLTILGDLVLIPAFGFIGPAYATLLANYTTSPIAILMLHTSRISATTMPYVKHTLALWLCAALFWLFQPTELPYRIAIIALFAGLNLATSAITSADLRLLTSRSTISPETL